MKKYKFPIFLLLAVLSILLGLIFATGGGLSGSQHFISSALYYLALGVTYIFTYTECTHIYTYMYIYLYVYILQILCFIRLKYSIIWLYDNNVNIFQVFNQYNILNNKSILMASLPLIIMLIGFIQYFDILRRITTIEKYEMGFKTWKSLEGLD